MRAYRIEPARSEDLDALPAIERAAAALFVGWKVADAVLGDTTSLDELADAQRLGHLWVAREAGGAPVGFALIEILDGGPHLEEIDVHPAHGRRGLGRALVDVVLSWARDAGHQAVTLTTFRDVPWNAPFYARAGFRELAPGELSPGLAELVREEAARGLDPERRVVMCCALGGRSL